MAAINTSRSPVVRAHAKRIAITTTIATTILSSTARKTGLFVAGVSMAVLNAATTLTAQLTYTDPDGGAQTYTWVNAVNEAVGTYPQNVVNICAKGGTTINLVVTAGTANNIIASGFIEESA